MRGNGRDVVLLCSQFVFHLQNTTNEIGWVCSTGVCAALKYVKQRSLARLWKNLMVDFFRREAHERLHVHEGNAKAICLIGIKMYLFGPVGLRVNELSIQISGDSVVNQLENFWDKKGNIYSGLRLFINWNPIIVCTIHAPLFCADCSGSRRACACTLTASPNMKGKGFKERLDHLILVQILFYITKFAFASDF